MMITRVTKVVNPRVRMSRPRHARSVANRRRHTSSSNPAHMLTLGFVNPKRKKVSMAKTRKRRRASRPRHASAVNRRHRTSNPRHRRRTSAHRRRSNPIRRTVRRRHNPTGGTMMKIVENTAAALVGLGTNNLAMGMLPASVTSGGGIMPVLASAAIAFGSGWLVSKWDKDLGLFVGIGSMMAAGQLAINTYVPSIGSTIGLSGYRGMGDFVNGKFAVPENPVMRGNPQAGGPMGGGVLSGAYPAPYSIAA
jgi:hypothetical protein